jgi:protocatechuate 3,4-dioxygenase beta subunit
VSARQEPARSSGAGLRLLVALVLAALVAWRIGGTPRGFRASAAVGGASAVPSTPAAAAGSELSGRLWLEGEGEGTPLEPATACTAVLWQEAVELARRSGACGEGGAWRLDLPAHARGKGMVELLVPGRLRGTFEVELDGRARRLPELALGFAVVLEGEVVDTRGEPVSGAHVQLRPEPDLGESEPWRAITDGSGRFRFDTIPPGPAVVRAWQRGYATSVAQALAPSTDVFIVLDPLVTLRGRVRGAPAGARVSVRVEGSSLWPARTVTADPGGGFELRDVPDGVFALDAQTVDAHAEGGVPLVAQPVAAVEAGGEPPDLELVPAARLAVQVRDGGGNPVPGARVTATPDPLGMLARTAVADAYGRATFAALAPAPHLLQADAAGYLASEPVAARLREGPQPREVVLVVARPARISGRVVDEAGRGVGAALIYLDGDGLLTAGASLLRAEVVDATLLDRGSLGVTVGPVPDVPAFESGGALVGAAAVTDRAGDFVVEGLAPGRYRVHAEHGSFARSATVEVRLRSGAHRDGLLLALRSGSPLRGRVRDGNRRVIAGALVEADDGTSAVTDAHGVFDLGPHRGSVVVVVRAPGKAPQRLELEAGAAEVEVALADADARLTGRVRDEAGQVVEGVFLEVRSLDGLAPTRIVESDARGLFELDGLAAGPVEVVATHPGFAQVLLRTSVARAAEPVELRVMSAWRLVVRVERARTREPVVGATVEVAGSSQVTDGAGRAEFSLPRAPAATVEVRAPGAVPLQREARPSGAPPRTELFVELESGGSIEGVLTDYRGDPLAGVTVRLEAHGAQASARPGSRPRWEVARSDAAGAFVFTGLAEGTYELSAVPPPERSAELRAAAARTDVRGTLVTRDVSLRFDRRTGAD